MGTTKRCAKRVFFRKESEVNNRYAHHKKRKPNVKKLDLCKKNGKFELKKNARSRHRSNFFPLQPKEAQIKLFMLILFYGDFRVRFEK